MAKVRGIGRRYRVPYSPTCGSYLPTEIQQCIDALKIVDEQMAVKGPKWWQLANRKTGIIRMDFNGMTLSITARSTVEGVQAVFNADMDRRREKYVNSPAGRKQAAKYAAKLVQYQADADAAMADLVTLNFDDIEAAVNWMCRIEPCFGYGDVVTARQEVLVLFAEHGYLPGVNCGDDYIASDSDNSGRYLVGQGLDGIKAVGSPHPIIHKFAAEWRAKFGFAAVPDPYGHDDEDDEDEE